MTAGVYTGVPVPGWRSRLNALAPPLGVVGVAAAGCAVVALADPTTPGGVLPTCPTKTLFGIICPGCGALRMIYSVLHGDLPAALHYNAVSLAVLVLFAWSMIAWTAGRLRGRWVPSWLHWRWAPIATGVVIAVWTVVRNLPFEPFVALRV
ncbi:DUF2752 domain-containing protein [Amycolatopsis palatopharyngis]|uniref:DUF2752 domain-containing protein n=1 Tax=Amycolatopsis palatopharyngis TaxID=187982 RepID=UPI000E21FDCB|nr:DUF2752 domain-containing protein [Amycolatopsis palatopharyngis]